MPDIRSPLKLNGIPSVGDIAPVVTVLTDAATVLVDASLGNHFRLTLTASGHTIGAPSNPDDGEKITIEIVQPSSGGPYTVIWSSATGGYEWGTTVTVPTLTVTASKRDYITFIYNATANKWAGVAYALGYT